MNGKERDFQHPLRGTTSWSCSPPLLPQPLPFRTRRLSRHSAIQHLHLRQQHPRRQRVRAKKATLYGRYRCPYRPARGLHARRVLTLRRGTSKGRDQVRQALDEIPYLHPRLTATFFHHRATQTPFSLIRRRQMGRNVNRPVLRVIGKSLIIE